MPKTFFMAGFECATGFNRHREWIDQIAATQHDLFAYEDYAALKHLGIRSVREGVRWPLIDRPRGYDFSSLDPFLEAADKLDMELILDLFHYGYPEDVDLFSASFIERFASYCHEVANYVCPRLPIQPLFTPINEPSYFAWAAGDACQFAPYCQDRSFELKTWLARGAIRGIEAIWDASPDARIVNVDALCRVVPPIGCMDMHDKVNAFNEIAVFQSWDMIAGKLFPEFGGSMRHLDIVGLNYYWTNQWEYDQGGTPLFEEDERCWPLRDLVRWAWHRYRSPIMISETSHKDELRAPWLATMTREIEALLDEKIPILGVCLYPVLGMPEWHDQQVWTNMGLWDLQNVGGRLERHPHTPMIDGLKIAMEILSTVPVASLSAKSLVRKRKTDRIKAFLE